MRSLLIAAVSGGVLVASIALAADFRITDFGRNGKLSWDSSLSNAEYRVEWCSDLTAPEWLASWSSLVEIVPTGSNMTVSVPMFYRVIATQPRTVAFADYFPTDPNIYRTKHFEGPYDNDYPSSTNMSLTGFKRVPYTSGAIIGVSDAADHHWHNDGKSVKLLGRQEWFFSTDASLGSHPTNWCFGLVHDGLIAPLPLAGFFQVKGDRSESSPWDEDMSLLFKLDDVTIGTNSYPDVVVVWSLDHAYPFVPLDFHGMDAVLGITIPTVTDTRGHSVTGFEVFARGIGPVCAGDVEAEFGDMQDLAQLQFTTEP